MELDIVTLSKIDKNGPIHPVLLTPCWLWLGPPREDGYGGSSVNGRGMKAHRAVWIKSGLDISPLLDLDHLCRNRICVNPGHLEPVTRGENLRRSFLTGPGINSRKTHCIRGHSLDDDSVYRYTDRRGNEHRRCTICVKAQLVGKIRIRKKKAA